MPPRKRGATAVFTCQRYPQLRLPILGVEFHQGRLETDDAQVAKSLRAMPAHYGITEEGGTSHEPADEQPEPDAEPEPVQRRSARRSDRD